MAQTHANLGLSPTLTGPPWLRSGSSVAARDRQWLAVTLMLVMCGLIFFGGRGLIQIVVVTLTTLLMYLLVSLLLSKFMNRPVKESWLHVSVLGLLMGCSLPVMERWLIPGLSGAMMGILVHLVGRSHRWRIHPVALTWVMLVVVPLCLLGILNPQVKVELLHGAGAVLKPERVVVGDVLDYQRNQANLYWWHSGAITPTDAVYRTPVNDIWLQEKHRILQHPPLLVNMMISGELPRLEELILGSTPDGIGISSRGLLVLLGLWLVYQRLSAWPMLLAALVGAIMVLPVLWVWHVAGMELVIGLLLEMSPPMVITWGSYQLLASPMLWTVLMLAPLTMPMSWWGRVIYGGLLGVLLTLLPWCWPVSELNYVALVLVGMLSPWLDHLQRCPLRCGQNTQQFSQPPPAGVLQR